MTRAVAITGYALIGLAIAVYQLAGILWGRTPTVGDTLALVIRSRAGRWLFLAFWLWLGWHIFVRANWG